LSTSRPHGEALIALGLMSELAARGHSITAFTKEADAGVEAMPWETVLIPDTGGLDSFAQLRYSRAARERLGAMGPTGFDIAHWLFPTGHQPAPPLPPAGQPLVVGPLMDPWPSRRRWWPPGFAVANAMSPYLARRYRRTLEGAGAVLVCTDQARRVLPNDRLASAAVELPYGVDTERFTVRPLPSTPTLLYVGRMERAKGVDGLVRAFAATAGRLPEARLLLAGQGTLVEELRSDLKRPSLKDRAEYLGVVEPQAMPELMAAASAVALPSVGEPFGMTLLEGMAAGRALLATNRNGPASIVVPGEGGILVEPGDESALTSGILELLEAPDRLQTMGQFNRRRAEQIYGWPRVAERLEAVYRRVLGARG
jgi:glycosyltransferase involved in cell wall biosynthesis